MALPTQSDLLTKGFMLDGETFMAVEAKSAVNTLINGFMLDGETFIAPSAAAATGNFFLMFR